MESFRRKQLIGIGLSLAAIVVVIVVLSQARRLFAAVPLPAGDAASRLAYVGRWLLAPGLTLLIGIHGAARRGFFRDAIDGTRTPASNALEINLRYNQNTLEQVVLAAIAWSGLAVTLPVERLALIPAMAALFVVGRISFWIGYQIYPIGRAFGMVLTATPTIGAYAWLVWRAFTR
ncbi:MAG TPA: hypothetical protein VG407_18140 [Caulobacteraceae bacterium]|jgi:hypothetical protein|nr:hypothetical protein [Caulobacteraceae bacterium]